MAAPVLPPLSTAVGSGTATLIGLRPKAEPFVSSGVWGHVFRGWRAQFALLRARDADEMQSSRVQLATGEALRELAASEFFVELTPDPMRAVGSVTLTRPASVSNQGGTIKEGFRFDLQADLTASPVVQGCAYESTDPVYVNASDTTVNIPIWATITGTSGNIPRYVGRAGAVISLAETLPTTLSTFAVTASDAAGGSTGIDDPDVRKLCSAMATGQWAANDAAIAVGALLDAGVKHAILIPDPVLGQTVVRVADASWASSSMLQRRVSQGLKAKWQGFGCRVQVLPIYNRLISVKADIVLTDPKYAADIAQIQAAITTELRDYFDNRPKFYQVYAETVAGIVARSDDRIMACPSAQIIDVATSTPFEQTPAQAAESRSHWFLTDNAVSLSIKPAS